MQKLLFFFGLILFAQSGIFAQCLSQPVCPGASQTFCDSTENNIFYWNGALFFDPVIQSHNLGETPTGLSMQLIDSCNTGDVQVSFVLLLDLDGNGIRETAISSDSLPGVGLVYYGNAANPNYTGGEARLFDTRDVPNDRKYRFTLEKIVQDSLVTVRVRWVNAENPNDYILPELPYGAHHIEWRFEKNGQVKTCGYDFVVKDCKPPTVTCIGGFSINITPLAPHLVQLSAVDFFSSSYLPHDNYTPSYLLKFGIRRLGTATGFPIDAPSVVFSCSDLGAQPLEVWALDKAGNASFCTTTIIIQDNNGGCVADTSAPNVCVHTACSNSTQGVEGVTFELTDSNPATPPFSFYLNDPTDNDGCVHINFPIVNTRLTPEKLDENPLNGVTAYDLILLSRHINGIQPFTENWQWVAADTDLNGIIDSSDLINCRKITLGILDDSIPYPGLRFYPQNFEFPTGNPLALPVPNYIVLDSVALSQTIKFAAVKTCDFNCNVIVDIKDITSSGQIGQPQPNPTAAGLSIPFILAQSTVVTVEMLDLTGRSLYKSTAPYNTGEQRMEIPATAFPQAGVYIWRVQAGAASRSGKIVKQ